ncbi:Beta-barrel assembly machine subunit BamA [Thalassobaculum litoreum DSM 18839]|uniref:Outer membrane protein assembly factor BamA n=1 Tax=Thalassobaculum litoreum DSM 18839 TaxID=1123362 RepID=A0A8G2BLE7_9PROT|nr:Beta-barrel assembly machine subunit BamA [Thalassobaculum litoreum DSM 18839]
MPTRLIRFSQVATLALTLALGAAPAVKAQFLSPSSSTVTDVVVEGTQRIDPATVRSYMLVQPGDSFESDRLDRSLKALYATGLFADVNMRRDGGTLVINVVENPIINRIAFEGNKRVDDEELDREVQLRPRLVYSRTRVQQDVQRIIEIYQRSGRYAVTVEPKVIRQDQNRVDLVFEIDEGELTPVRTITFLGNREFSDSTLRGVIQTKEYAFYRFLSSDDTYDPDRLSFDRELLRRYYLENGYADFRVLSAVAELAPDRESFVVTFTVEEGDLYTFGPTDFEVSLPRLEPEALREFVATEEGETYDSTLVDDTIDAITDYLGTLGYAFVDVRPRVNRDPENRTVSITYQVGEASKVFVERININGNVRTLDRVIRREMSLVEGDAFNTAKLRRSERRVRNLGFFKSVDVRNSEGSAPDRTVVDVEVEEQSTGEISFGIGFSTAESIIGDIGIRERNLLGRGQDLRFGITASGRSTEFDVAFTEPYFLDRDVAAGFDLFRIERELNESSYDELRFGGVLRASYTLQPDLTQQINYRIEQTEIKDVDDDASRFIKDQEGTRVISQVGQTLTYDKRDNRLDPREGYIAQLTTEVAGAGGDERFFRTRVKGGYYYPLDDVWGLSFLAQGGFIVGLGQDVSIAERFFIGASSFRGFERGGVGPRDTATDDALGANNYYVGSIELAFPSGLPKDLGVRTFLFTDVGSVWGVDESGSDVADATSIRASLGLGMSFTTAFGTIRIDAAEAVAKEDFDVPEIFRLSFGTRF